VKLRDVMAELKSCQCKNILEVTQHKKLESILCKKLSDCRKTNHITVLMINRPTWYMHHLSTA